MKEPTDNKSLPAEKHITDRKRPRATQNNKYQQCGRNANSAQLGLGNFTG